MLERWNALLWRCFEGSDAVQGVAPRAAILFFKIRNL